jgi:ketosteroid isomerase-like protein
MLRRALTRNEQKLLPRIALRGKRRRPLEDRFALRFPTIATRSNAWFTKIALRLPRRWRLRQLLVEFAAWRAYNAIGRGDLGVLRTINHADVIFDLSRWGWPEDSLYQGRDGVVRFNEQWISQWSKPNFDVASIEELDEPGVFLIHLELRGIGRTSGVEVEMDIFQLVKLRDGLIWRNTFFRDRAEAIEVAGFRRCSSRRR